MLEIVWRPCIYARFDPGWGLNMKAAVNVS
jgi:hypothetical protein